MCYDSYLQIHGEDSRIKLRRRHTTCFLERDLWVSSGGLDHLVSCLLCFSFVVDNTEK